MIITITITIIITAVDDEYTSALHFSAVSPSDR